MNKDLTKKDDDNLPFSIKDDELMKQMSKDAETHKDDTNTEDIAIPRITILQAMSKQTQKANKAEYIQGAEVGDFCNTVTNETIKGDIGFFFVPVKRRIVYIEWKDLALGGGLINNFGEDSTAYNEAEVDEKGKHIGSSADNEIIKTYEVFGYILNNHNDKFSEVLISMSKTQTKKMKKWNAMIRNLSNNSGKQLPEFAGIYRLKTIPESNDKGSWFNFNIDPAGYTLGVPSIGKMLYEKAKEFHNVLKEKNMNVKYENSTENVNEENDPKM